MHSYCLPGSLLVCSWILFDKQQLITEPKHTGRSWRLSSALSANDKVKLLNSGVLSTFVLSRICNCCSRTALISIDRGFKLLKIFPFSSQNYTGEMYYGVCIFIELIHVSEAAVHSTHPSALPTWLLCVCDVLSVWAVLWTVTWESFRVKHFGVRYMEEYLKVKLPSYMRIILWDLEIWNTSARWAQVLRL